MIHKDFIIGTVLQVEDENSLNVRVNSVGRKNRGEYRDEEVINILNLKTSEVVTLKGLKSRSSLKKVLTGKEVMCLVHSRSQAGQIDADVYIM